MKLQKENNEHEKKMKEFKPSLSQKLEPDGNRNPKI